MTLTDDQQAAYDAVYDRLASGERFTGLRGYAGTGKTVIVGQLVEQLDNEDCAVYVCAPTHKAVQVLRNHLSVGVPTQTLHAFLGLRLQPDGKGDYELVPDDREREMEASIVVVDEASMVGRDEWQYIQATPDRVQWLFVGDPAQLPPVNEEESPALQVPGPTLERVHRQAKGNPVLELATKVRNHNWHGFRSKYDDGQGVAITHNDSQFFGSLVRAFTSETFRSNPEHARILAYRNKTVRAYNRRVRAERYGEQAARFEIGEWIVARETWFHDQRPLIKNSEEVRVEAITEERIEGDDMSTWKVWTLKVRGIHDDFRRDIAVLHDDEHERYRDTLTHRRDAAKDDHKKWDRYYSLREQFAKVDYAYASTVHKAQGSTFDTVFVDYRDLQVCRGPEQHALLYVAVTRPSRRLAMLV
jgi:exodeoxyribonuclease-5